MDTLAQFHLTRRDVDVILMVHSYAGCTVEQVRRRFFATPGARSACYARVLRLMRAGYLVGRRLPSQTGVGSGRAFLTTGHRSRPVLASALGASRSELGRSRTRRPAIIEHHLAICDARASFELAAEGSEWCRLLDWQRDGEVVLHAADPKTQMETPIIPDSTLTLELSGGAEQAFYLEMDLDTMPARRMKAKLRAYLLRSMAETTAVLYVVPDARRQKDLAHWAVVEARELGVDSTIFWLTERAHISEFTVLKAPIWQIAGGPAAIALSLLVAGGETTLELAAADADDRRASS